MEIVLTRDLVEGDILAKDLMDNYGNILLKNGTVLSKAYILKLKAAGIFYVVVERINKDKKICDERLNIIKETMVNAIPEFFNSILNKDKNKIEKEITIVDDMIEHIIKTGEINTSIFDLQEYDNYTYIHCVNTSIMSTFIGIQLNVRSKELRSLALGAILHDIGKMKLPIEILNKRERLSDAEFNEIKNHSKNGNKILRDADISDEIILDIVLQHHERLDGTGYPYSITSNEISEYAKIVSLCDVFTALTANRCYRDRFSPNDAYEFIISEVDKMFDSKVVEIFKKSFAIYPKGCKVRISNGLEGIVIEQNPGFPDRPIVQVYYDNNLDEKIKVEEINLLNKIDLVITDTLPR